MFSAFIAPALEMLVRPASAMLPCPTAPTESVDGWVVVSAPLPKPRKSAPRPVGTILGADDVKSVLKKESVYTGYDPLMGNFVGCLPTGWQINIETCGADPIGWKASRVRVVRLDDWYYIITLVPVERTRDALVHLVVSHWKIVDYNESLDNACLAANSLLMRL